MQTCEWDLYPGFSWQYYYNSQSGQFLYWDGEKQTYVPAQTDADGKATGPQDEEKVKKDKDKKEKVKVAKKIAKVSAPSLLAHPERFLNGGLWSQDMEKWAKSMNAQKEAMKEGFKRNSMPSRPDKESAAADAGFAILEKTKTERLTDPKKSRDDKRLMPPPAMVSLFRPFWIIMQFSRSECYLKSAGDALFQWIS